MKTPQEIVSESGYPLQISIEHAVNSSVDNHQWSVISHEFPWLNTDTREHGFIDLLQEHQGGVMRMIVECKHHSGSWIFLSHGKTERITKDAKVLFCRPQPDFKLQWIDQPARPKSSQSAFCVKEIEGKKDSRTLESIVDDVLLSVEAVARTELDLGRVAGTGVMGRLYIPVVVTTAKLKLLVFDEADIESGNIDQAKSEVEEIPYIRFTKSLATNLAPEYSARSTLVDVYRASERTVFVVEANRFVEFLGSFRLG